MVQHGGATGRCNRAVHRVVQHGGRTRWCIKVVQKGGALRWCTGWCSIVVPRADSLMQSLKAHSKVAQTKRFFFSWDYRLIKTYL